MALFPPGKGGGEGVGYGYKGKGILIHSITEAQGMPVAVITTPANRDERQQVLPMLAQIRLATGKRGNPKHPVPKYWRMALDTMPDGYVELTSCTS